MTAHAPASVTPLVPSSCARATPPRQPPGHIRRAPLQRRLLQQDCRLRLLVGPAGFGKSVLLADCARAAPAGCTTLWLSCAGQPWSPATLCAQLALALGYPPGGEAQLLACLEHEPRHLWLFLDDYPRAPDAALDACLERLLGAAADGIRWWLGSRRRPTCNLPRLLLEGELLELSAADLCFSGEEVGAWLRQVAATRLAWADSLLAQSRGWPAALRLCLLAAQGEPGVLVPEHDGLLREYIEHEVLHGLPRELEQALGRLAQIPRFNAELCEHLLGVGEGADWLQALRARGLFIDELEGQAGWYEVFAPMAALLQQRAKGGSCARLHLQASQWFAACGDTRSAVEHALKGGQPEVAASFLERFTEEQVLQGQDLALILRWRGELPESLLLSTPRLILLNAWVLLLVGRLDEAQACADQLARFQPRADGERTVELFAQWQALSGILAFGRGCAEQARRHLAEALARLPEQAWAQSLLCRSALTQMAIGEGRLEQAQRLGYEALKQARRCGSAVFEALLELDHGLLLESRGEFARAQALLQRVYEQLEAQPARSSPVRGRMLLRLGRLALRQGQLEQAADQLQTGLDEALRHEDPGAFHGFLGLAELAARQRDIPGAFAHLAEAERLMQRQRVADTLYRGVLLLASSRLWLWQGHRPRAREALSRVLEHGQRHRALLPPATFPELLPRLRQLLLRVELEQGADVRQPLRVQLDQALAEGRQALAGELWLSLAEACAAAGDAPAAAQARQAGQALRQRLNYRCLWFEADEGPAGSAANGDGPTPLSGREVTVLRLIAQGCSNQEVAEQLYISLHTVKTHARRINGKLGVTRRTQAVARAKALGLL
ncbi:LuxR C-terminal-related transcriptional regulator [Pseudomonas benzenivorans]|uniref:helix-turn-helix transcriptional regulator n=1 Tax=Pseudomonas benzenivorans TaxID=556533 RepID=UPI0035112CB1